LVKECLLSSIVEGPGFRLRKDQGTLIYMYILCSYISLGFFFCKIFL